MGARSRSLLFVALVAVCGVAAAVAIAAGVRSQDPRVATSEASRKVLADAQAEGRRMVLFRSLEPEGQVAVAPVDGGETTFEPLSCDRVYFASGRGLCVARVKAITAGYGAKIFGTDLRVQHEIALDGVPSRARVSPDGRYGTVTMFVTGHSYAQAGSFSTTTTLIDMARGETIAELEEFTVTREGRQVTTVDVNFWGVTFVPGDSDRFYATLATGGKTYLIEGSVSGRVAHVIHENVECPSISPDGTRIAYKSRTASESTPWRLSVLDLSTMRETRLAEARSIDDQAEWLDDDKVLYGLEDQVWVVPADGSGTPERFLPTADSPAVVRW
jgi:WD40-like Beta Propeller Repeat